MSGIFAEADIGRVFSFFAEYLGIDSVWRLLMTILDIAIIAYAIYKLFGLLKSSKAASLVQGVIIFVILAIVARVLKLTIVSTVLSAILSVLPVIIVILFQPEFRKMLEKLGNSNLLVSIKSLFENRSDDEARAANAEMERIIDETVDAAIDMGQERVGALIVFEKSDDTSSWAEKGTRIDAAVSSRLLKQIFVKNTPLHDGAVIIANRRIHSAQCILPLTDDASVSRELGTRHRAAIGATQDTDCVVVVVSEETGNISFVSNGVLIGHLSGDTLRKLLRSNLLEKTGSNGKGSLSQKANGDSSSQNQEALPEKAEAAEEEKNPDGTDKNGDYYGEDE